MTVFPGYVEHRECRSQGDEINLANAQLQLGIRQATIILCRIPETINFWISAQEHWLSVKCNSSIVQGPGSKKLRSISHESHSTSWSDFTIFSTSPGTFLIWENQLSSFAQKFWETSVHLCHPSLDSPLLGLQWLSRSMVYVFIKPNQRVPKWMVHVTLMLMISVHKFICPHLAYKEKHLVSCMTH